MRRSSRLRPASDRGAPRAATRGLGAPSRFHENGVPGGSGETSGAAACAEADPLLDFAVHIEAEAWPVEVTEAGDPLGRWIHAACKVSSVTEGAGNAELALLCSEGDTTDAPVTVRLEGRPEGFRFAVAPGSDVVLDYQEDAPGHHASGGSWLGIQDASRSRVVLAAIQNGSFSAANDALGPLSVGNVEAGCSSVCEDPAGCYRGPPERQAVVVEGEGGERAEVLDGTRGKLEVSGTPYDIVVATAVYNPCLNCGSSYAFLIGAR